MRIQSAILVSFVFLVTNVVMLRVILALNRRAGPAKMRTHSQPAAPEPEPPAEKSLSAADILGWEFEYARITASEALQDRYTMVNFYLLVVAAMGTGVIAILGREADLPKPVGTALLWILCAVGWIYFLKIIRLRPLGYRRTYVYGWTNISSVRTRVYVKGGRVCDRIV